MADSMQLLRIQFYDGCKLLVSSGFMLDSNPIFLDTVLCQLQITLNLSRTHCIGYKTFFIVYKHSDTNIRIQTFYHDCNYLVSTTIATSITEGNTAVYNTITMVEWCIILSQR